MTLRTLVGKKLKDDEVFRLMEDHRLGPVVYEFDRLHEGTPDSYWLEARKLGFALRFDDHQTLAAIHCYVAPADGFTAIDPALIGVPLHASRDEVVAATTLGTPVSKGDAHIPELGLRTMWARIEAKDLWTHYEFRTGRLTMVTLDLPWP